MASSELKIATFAEEMKAVDDLTEAGWYMLQTDFDYTAFIHWKRKTLGCVKMLLGPESPYATYLQDCYELLMNA